MIMLYSITLFFPIVMKDESENLNIENLRVNISQPINILNKQNKILNNPVQMF